MTITASWIPSALACVEHFAERGAATGRRGRPGWSGQPGASGRCSPSPAEPRGPERRGGGRREGRGAVGQLQRAPDHLQGWPCVAAGRACACAASVRCGAVAVASGSRRCAPLGRVRAMQQDPATVTANAAEIRRKTAAAAHCHSTAKGRRQTTASAAGRRQAALSSGDHGAAGDREEHHQQGSPPAAAPPPGGGPAGRRACRATFASGTSIVSARIPRSPEQRAACGYSRGRCRSCAA